MDEDRTREAGEEHRHAAQMVDGSPVPASSPLPRRAFSPLMVSGGGDPTSSSSPLRASSMIRRTTPTNNNRQSQHRIRYEDLLNRPRSNPRSRTPMRYESPIDSTAFRREAVLTATAAEEEAQQQRRSTPTIGAGGTRRITVRPMAGAAVGTMPAPRRRVQEQQQQQRDLLALRAAKKSYKQGPSQRKVRRWKHENFIDLASEFAKNDKDGRGKATAEAILQGKADAHLYRDVYNPEDVRSKAISSFMGDENLREIRDKFFECELSEGKRSINVHRKKRVEDNIVTPKKLIQRIDKRLQLVVEKACKNSFPACKVVESFESFLVRSFIDNVDDLNHKEDSSFAAIIEDVLLKPPIVTRAKSKNENDENTTIITTVQMFFDGESPTGGFHRLLVHAAAQFHGLNSKSNLVDGIQIEEKDGSSGINNRGHRNRARVLTVTGKSVMGKEYKVLDHILDRKADEDQKYQYSIAKEKGSIDVSGTAICRKSNSNRDILNMTEKDREDSATEGWELVEAVKIVA